MLVDESVYEIFKKVSDLTLTDYEIRWFKAENIEGYILAENMLSMIEDLLCEIDNWEEKYKNFEQYVEDNYRHLTYAEQID